MPDHDADVAAVSEPLNFGCSDSRPPMKVTHDATVAAVLDEVLRYGTQGYWGQQREQVLAALSAAGIACVYVPEGVEVEHGARLVQYKKVEVGWRDWREAFVIEDTP